MLLAQFVLIIIDRALYLRKQVIGKFFFHIFLVLLVHVWIFFVLPHITGRSAHTLSLTLIHLLHYDCKLLLATLHCELINVMDFRKCCIHCTENGVLLS